MSDTHRTKPLGVKACQHLTKPIAVHNHTNGVCDLPELKPENVWAYRQGRCFWNVDWSNPISHCACRTCSGNEHKKTNNRRGRKNIKQKLHDIARDPGSYDDEPFNPVEDKD